MSCVGLVFNVLVSVLVSMYVFGNLSVLSGSLSVVVKLNSMSCLFLIRYGIW